jgi:hypothetical protein
MRNPCGVLIGKGHPKNLFEVQQRVCEIEENITSSLIQEEYCLEETFQINQIDEFVVPYPPCDIKTYLQKEREEAAKKIVDCMMNLLGKEEHKLKNAPSPKNEVLKVERKQATK